MKKGLCNKQIAQQLGLSGKTVEIHVTAVLRKAGVSNRTALVARLWGAR
ncbi:MAG: LuxR C-terminal-related transcriptional regulator [Polyangiaceae bacterium]|nr:LuxR C-terminal-related transcriptional regulator [Polyangiaceae bacterium]